MTITAGMHTPDAGSSAEPAAPGRGAATIPLALPLGWWVAVLCDAILAADVIAAAQLLERPRIYLSLVGPVWLGAVLALIAWWHTRGLGRHWWR